MEALHAAVKAELGEDGLPTGGGAEVPAAEHGYGWSVPMMPVKAEAKTEINVDLRESLVNVETTWPDNTRAAISRPSGAAAHGLVEGIADEEGWRRVQPTRGAKRRAVSYWADVDTGSDFADEEWTSTTAPRRRKVARVTQVTQAAEADRPQAWKKHADWERHLVNLTAYKRRHGDCNVTQRWAEDPRLGRWVMTQRRRKKARDRGDPNPHITAARVAKLDALGFAWERLAAEISSREDADWERHLANLTAYKRRHGDCNVTQTWAEDPALGRWVMTQRRRKKALDRGDPHPYFTAARVAKLDALGFAWELSAGARSKQLSKGNRDDAGWDGWLTKLKVYRRKYGDCCVPQGWTADSGLGRWVNNQRQYKKALDRGDSNPHIMAARVAKLEALGFAWELSASELSSRDDADWERHLGKLMAYQRRHGDCNVTQRWAEDPALSIWVMTQRAGKRKLDRGGARPKITVVRVAKLDALGFAWERR
jgi:hypothetical protein